MDATNAGYCQNHGDVVALPMSLLTNILEGLRGLLRKGRVEEELDEELRAYADAVTERNMSAGLSEEQAWRAARLEVGNLEAVKEQVRDVSWERAVEVFWQDVRLGLRLLRKSPAFTIVAVLTLSLGIGANTTIFSMIDSFFLRPLPVYQPEQITVLAFRQGEGPLLTPFSVADFRDIRDQAKDRFSDMVGYVVGTDGFRAHAKTEAVVIHYVTGNYFDALGVKPALGRVFLPSEGRQLGNDPVAVLSYSCWTARFGGDPDIIGRQVAVNGHPLTVVGVAERGFDGLDRMVRPKLYLPLGMVSLEGYPNDFMVRRILQNLLVFGRLKAHVSIREAQASLDVVAARLATQHPESDKGLSLFAFPERLARPDPNTSGKVIRAAELFLGLVMLVLLLACVNVGNIMLVRVSAREREMAIRAALGAERKRLIRQLLTESIILAFLGGAIGLVLGAWASQALTAIPFHTNLPISLEFAFDWRVFAYAFLIVLTSGVIVGIVPTVRLSFGNLRSVLDQSGRTMTAGQQRLRTALAAGQVAGSLALLITAALFFRSLESAKQTELGFDKQHLLTLSMDPSEVSYDWTQGLEFYERLLSRVRSLPGVESASLASNLPLAYSSSNDYLNIRDYPLPPGQPPPLVYYGVVSPGYFDTMRIPLVRGRGFSDRDARTAPPVAVVNEAMATFYWPHQNPIGKRFAKVSGTTNPVYEVVGIAKNSRFSSIAGPIDAYFYLPLAQNYDLASGQTLLVRTARNPGTMLQILKSETCQLTPDIPVFAPQSMEDALDTLNGLLSYRIAAALAAALGLIGLALAILGVYGVVSYATSQRSREMAIRVALGARRTDILKNIFHEGLFIVAPGVTAGLLLALAIGRLVKGFLVDVSATDPFTYLAMTTVLSLVALMACYIPAQRIARIDPAVALRGD
jgi:predicted permease